MEQQWTLVQRSSSRALTAEGLQSNDAQIFGVNLCACQKMYVSAMAIAQDAARVHARALARRPVGCQRTRRELCSRSCTCCSSQATLWLPWPHGTSSLALRTFTSTRKLVGVC
jgi:hypothetical protein